MTMLVKNLEDFEQLEERELEELYSWVDKIPLSRPKRNICRDFSDGVLTAELVKHFLPRLVDIHNYTSASSTQQKMDNWDLLNRKVFNKLNFQLASDTVRAISTGKMFSIERFLMFLRSKIDRAIWDIQKAGATFAAAKGGGRGYKNTVANDKPEVDQNMSPQTVATQQSPKKSTKTQGPPPMTVSPGRQKGTHAASQAGPYRGTKIKTIDDTVPRAVFEEKEQECLAKEETIQILQAKVRRLEHLLHLKDIRIEDLQSRVESTRPTGGPKR